MAKNKEKKSFGESKDTESTILGYCIDCQTPEACATGCQNQPASSQYAPVELLALEDGKIGYYHASYRDTYISVNVESVKIPDGHIGIISTARKITPLLIQNPICFAESASQIILASVASNTPYWVPKKGDYIADLHFVKIQ